MSRKKMARERKRPKSGRHQENVTDDDEPDGFYFGSDPDARYTSTPMRRIQTVSGTVRLERIKSMENRDSGESEETRPQGRYLRRARSARSLRGGDESGRGEGGTGVDENRKKRKRSKRGKSGDNFRGSSSRMRGEADAVDRPKRKVNRYHGKGTVELPIAEILKKAQENNQTRYEEPIPLPELTTDTLYVQGRNGFNPVKIGKDPYARKWDRFAKRAYQPIHVAIHMQKYWKSASLVFQGLFGGVALMHFVMIEMYFAPNILFLAGYSSYSEIYTNLFSFFTVTCFLAAMDKFDVAHLDLDHVREICIYHVLSSMTIPLYFIVFCLHLMTIQTDDKLSLLNYNNTMWEDLSNLTNSTETFHKELETFYKELETFYKELDTWRQLIVWKDVLAVFTWIFVSMGSRGDLLLIHLDAMQKYTGQPDSMED